MLVFLSHEMINFTQNHQAGSEIMTHLSQHNTETLHALNEIFDRAVDQEKYGYALKAVELKMKLHTLMLKDVDPIEQLKQLNIDDVPPECLQTWLTQFREKQGKALSH